MGCIVLKVLKIGTLGPETEFGKSLLGIEFMFWECGRERLISPMSFPGPVGVVLHGASSSGSGDELPGHLPLPLLHSVAGH